MTDTLKVLEKDFTERFRHPFEIGEDREQPALARVPVDAAETEPAGADGAAMNGASANGGPGVEGSQAASPGQPVETAKRGRGAPPGNHNALKHGLYARSLTPEEREVLGFAQDAKGLENEIVVLRVKIDSLLANPLANADLLLRAFTALTRMVRTHDLVQHGR